MGVTSLPGVWPLKGTCVKAFQFYYGTPDAYKFPPPGFMMEVSYVGELREADVGCWTRDCHDTIFFAWLLKLESVKDDPPALEQMRKAAEHVTMTFHLRATEQDRIAAAYQMIENEETNANLLGHSLLRRARELASIQETLAKSGQPSSALDIASMFEAKKMKWASSESKMTVGTIRLHLRILRRFSMAVSDMNAPSYDESALYYFDRNEELWGRRSVQVILQESTKLLDSFQATGCASRLAIDVCLSGVQPAPIHFPGRSVSLPPPWPEKPGSKATVVDLGDLRLASETLHILMLRGCPVKFTGRSVGDVVIM